MKRKLSQVPYGITNHPSNGILIHPRCIDVMRQNFVVVVKVVMFSAMVLIMGRR